MEEQLHNEATFPSAQIDLEEILIQAQAGNLMAFETIWKLLNPRMLRFAAAQCYQSSLDYEEIVSEAWVSIAKDISKFNGSFNEFRAWVFTLIRNRMIDGTRKRDRQVKPAVDLANVESADRSTSMEDLIESDEAVREIVSLIKMLPIAQAEVVMLRVVGDLSVAEAAHVVGKSENSVRVLCHRGLATLREGWTERSKANG